MSHMGNVLAKVVRERDQLEEERDLLRARVAELEAQHTQLRIEINKRDADLQSVQRKYDKLKESLIS